MKKLSLFILGAVCSLQLVAQEFNSAIDYNDYIVEQQNKVGEAILTFNDVMASDDATKESIQPYHELLISTCREGLGNLHELSDYEGNDELRQAAIDLFNFYVLTFTDDYTEMIEILFGENSDEETMDNLNALLEKITIGEGEFDNGFAMAQASFSELYGFDLLENELQEEIDEE